MIDLRRIASFFGQQGPSPEEQLRPIRQRIAELHQLPNPALRAACLQARNTSPVNISEVFALTAAVAHRELGLEMFDVQLLGALSLERGEIAEMQTGEGKTLAAVPAIISRALAGRGVHVLTANDYLASRDAAWMFPIYSWFDLTCAAISQHSTAAERRAAYAADITYATANEVGFDFLRDGLARTPDELVLRPFAFAVIDEADSILIDEARIPLVIAGGLPEDPTFAVRIDALVTTLHPGAHYVIGEFGRNVHLTDPGIARVEHALDCGSLFDAHNLRILTAVEDALHAHALLRRDVDYVVKNGAVELVDEWKGRIAEDRRWPAGIQSALEAKEHVPLKPQGRVLGSITVQSLIALYERTCGMTGTAATQAEEFWKVYRLPVAVIPTHRPVIRIDQRDLVFHTKQQRDAALVEEIRTVHTTGRPILVGTASIHDSEALSAQLTEKGIPHSVLNARNNEAEAQIIAQAGALGAVTISTNMAGRGTDIVLGGNPPAHRDRVLSLGGLYVIGTTRHEARRIDHQLRGRAGRQGDPGESRFFLSLEDDLLVRFGVAKNPDIDSLQRTAESQNIELRQLLWKYESVVEHHRHTTQQLRRAILLSPDWSVTAHLSEELADELITAAGSDAVETAGRALALVVLDDLWADYLANVADLRGGIHWVTWGGNDPLHSFLVGLEEIYADFRESFDEELADAFSAAEVEPGSIRFPNAQDRFERGATWTYLTTDQPFGTLGERLSRGLLRKFSSSRQS